MSSGWIKVHRSLLDWEWYSDEKVFRLFMHCLLSANHKDKRYRGTVIKRGQFLTSQELLGFQTGLSRQSIRKCLKCLKETNELTIDSSSKGTRIEVVNYDKYQNTTNELTSEPTIEQPTNNQQPTTNKNDKNYKNDKEVKKKEVGKPTTPKNELMADRLNKFVREVMVYCRENSISQTDCEAFINYWGEPNRSNTKFNAELQKTFSIPHRFNTWLRRKKEKNVAPKKESRQDRILREAEEAWNEINKLP